MRVVQRFGRPGKAAALDRLTSAQLEELDYRELYRAYSPKGRKSAADPQVMLKVMVYGYQCGIYSSRKLDELRRRWEEYEGKLSNMGEGRNSYSKTDKDATFMRMKKYGSIIVPVHTC